MLREHTWDTARDQNPIQILIGMGLLTGSGPGTHITGIIVVKGEACL